MSMFFLMLMTVLTLHDTPKLGAVDIVFGDYKYETSDFIFDFDVRDNLLVINATCLKEEDVAIEFYNEISFNRDYDLLLRRNDVDNFKCIITSENESYVYQYSYYITDDTIFAGTTFSEYRL